MSESINNIRQSRDKIVAGLDIAVTKIGDELAEYATRDDYLARLSRRLQALTNERAEVYERASDEVVALSEVQAAGSKLVSLGEQMDTAASAMRNVIRTLDKSTRVLTVAQQFVDTIASSQRA